MFNGHYYWQMPFCRGCIRAPDPVQSRVQLEQNLCASHYDAYQSSSVFCIHKNLLFDWRWTVCFSLNCLPRKGYDNGTEAKRESLIFYIHFRVFADVLPCFFLRLLIISIHLCVFSCTIHLCFPFWGGELIKMTWAAGAWGGDLVVNFIPP